MVYYWKRQRYCSLKLVSSKNDEERYWPSKNDTDQSSEPYSKRNWKLWLSYDHQTKQRDHRYSDSQSLLWSLKSRMPGLVIKETEMPCRWEVQNRRHVVSSEVYFFSSLKTLRNSVMFPVPSLSFTSESRKRRVTNRSGHSVLARRHGGCKIWINRILRIDS